MADKPPYLSPSSAAAFVSCPRRWRFKYVDRLPDPSGRAALVGTFAHRVLELLCQDEPRARTVEAAKDLARRAWDEFAATDDYRSLEFGADDARAFRWEAWLAIAGLWEIEDPATVDVVSTEQKLQVELGSVPFVGIIDRVDRIGRDLVVSDYKSGTLPGYRWRHDKIQQVMLYAAALQSETGRRPSRARLLYLGQRILDIRVTQARIDNALAMLTEAWVEIDQACGDDEFEPRPSVLCGWCPFVEQCPEGRAELVARAEAGSLPAHAPSAALVA